MGVGSRGDNVHNLWRVLLRILGLKVTHLVMSVAREVPLSILFSRGPVGENTADWRPRLPHPGTHCCIQVRPCFSLAAPRQWQSIVGVVGRSCFCLTQGSSYGKLALREFRKPLQTGWDLLRTALWSETPSTQHSFSLFFHRPVPRPEALPAGSCSLPFFLHKNSSQ